MDQAQNGIALQAFIASMAIVFLLSTFVILFFVKYQRRLLAQQKARLKAETDYQRDLLNNTINSQEAERNRIAKELHDEIGAMLTTTKLYAGQINPELSTIELSLVTDKMNLLFDDMIQNTRRISQDLRPVILEKLGLIEGIENLIATINATGKLLVVFASTSNQITDKQIELNVYRIIQELLNNALKHAEASEVEITLETIGTINKLNYRDNGKGIDHIKLKKKIGIGLKNIESRVSVLSGTLHFSPVKKGTEIEVEFPNNPDSNN
ncbi:MAG: signal transduction histidine kinase [Crocinitomix sp.]|jgi:signal transduction histidine kinase